MEPFTNSCPPPLVHCPGRLGLYGERELAARGSKRPDADMLATQEALLAAVICRIGEVEAAEWTRDQAKTACVVQIAAAWPPECRLKARGGGGRAGPGGTG